MEQEFPVRPILTRYMCDNCDGEMSPTGTMYATNPPKWEHICNKCGTTITLDIKYPRIDWKVN